MRCLPKSTVLLMAVSFTLCTVVAQQPLPTSGLTAGDVEKFLLTAKMTGRRPIPVGIAKTTYTQLDDGKLQHRAHITTVNISLASFKTDLGVELNFRDKWNYNVAAYELAKLLEFPLIPPSVERKVAGDEAAFTWWIDDAIMEGDRKAKKIAPPDLEKFNLQMYSVRVFNQLIYNTDPNLTNLLMTKDGNLWMIDHTRAFRLMKTLENPKNLVMTDRKVLAKMRELTKPLLTAKLGRWLTGPEIDGVLARRDKIVEFFDKEIKANGESAVLFDLAPRKY